MIPRPRCGGNSDIRIRPAGAARRHESADGLHLPAAESPLRLVQEWWGDDEADDFDAGWDDYYLGPLKELLER